MGFLIAKQGSGLRPAPCFACGRLRRLAAARCASLGSLKALQTPGSGLRAVRREGQGLGRLEAVCGPGISLLFRAKAIGALAKLSEAFGNTRKAVGSLRKPLQRYRKVSETSAKPPEAVGKLSSENIGRQRDTAAPGGRRLRARRL